MSSNAAEAISDSDVRRIIAGGDLEALEGLFDHLWYALPGRFGEDVIALVSALPPHVLQERPRLLHLVFLAYQAGAAAPEAAYRFLTLYTRTSERFARTLRTYTGFEDFVTASVVAMVGSQMRGDLEEARRIGAWAERRQRAFRGAADSPLLSGSGRARPGWFSTQRGVVETLAGDWDAAMAHYGRAYAEGALPPYGHFAAANAAANLALLAAYQGHHALAALWLRRAEGIGELPDWLRPLSMQGASIAHALLAIDRGDRRTAARHLKRAGDPASPAPLWPFVAYARGVYDAVFGQSHAGLVRLEAASFSHGRELGAETTIANRLLSRARASLLIPLGEGNKVIDIGRRFAGTPHLAVPHATVLLRSGSTRAARRIAAAALAHDELPVGDLIGLHLIIAVACLQEGDTQQAAEHFRRAVLSRHEPTMARPFLILTREELERLSVLAGIQPLIGPDWLPRSAQVPVPTVIRLTRREREVLDALLAGHTAKSAAELFGVAPTTTRSQIRSLYKKLGVSTRQDALARAAELGLAGAGAAERPGKHGRSRAAPPRR
ncbi:helix-turn-helix transcriptional regulator [Microbacterium sp. Marseille-Q6965]|uniref:helix-turn-helix domain-containing protein n=1 Tax=Microbacterium sp. Marseille-Q6965 TaxID=2965072 RepID=UPI0021B76D7F|nr:helix-turn-helix transcriptional regulator [Microbacterium sp. Marseille-Q6965]